MGPTSAPGYREKEDCDNSNDDDGVRRSKENTIRRRTKTKSRRKMLEA